MRCFECLLALSTGESLWCLHYKTEPTHEMGQKCRHFIPAGLEEDEENDT